jgi:hypothetical protein
MKMGKVVDSLFDDAVVPKAGMKSNLEGTKLASGDAGKGNMAIPLVIGYKVGGEPTTYLDEVAGAGKGA